MANGLSGEGSGGPRGETSKPVLVEKGPITVLTLNRPERMNALNLETVVRLGEIVEELRADREVRAVIVTGAGERAFSSGADLKEREGMSEEQVRLFIRTIRDTFTAIENLPQPVIAAINGVALGGGTELALACDLRIAAESAVLGLTEVALAIIPGAGGTQRLPRLVGRARAKELILLGKRISAIEALNIGLVNRVEPIDRLMGAAGEWGGTICANGPVAVRQAKYAINRGLDMDLVRALELESQAYEALIPTYDRKEGLAAFREKRKPVYRGE